MAVADLPPMTFQEERIVCSIAASLEYYVPADVLLAVAEVEGGRPGTVSRNENGTVDIGPMQFNSAYLRTLGQYGITREDVNQPGCYPYRLAAWRIKNHIVNDKGDLWTRVANYHSRTSWYNQIYREKVIKKARKWAIWLKKVFDVHRFEG